MKPSKPFSLKKNTNKPLFNKEQQGDNNVLEQSNDNQEQSIGQYGINKPNFGVKKSYEKPFISSQQQKIQELDEDELLNNKPKNKGPTLRKPGNSRLGQRPTQNISSNKNLIQQQINTDNLDENALLNTKPNMIKPNFKKKNPSIHNQQQNQQFSDSNQNNNFNISAQEQQVPINKSTLVNNRPQLLSKNREKKFIPTMEPIQRQEPENIQYQQKQQQQQQIDPEDYQKFQQTVSQPFGPGAKNKLFKPKINPEEALKKAQKDVFGKDINPQMSYENRNLYKEKQEKQEQNQKQYLNQQKQAFEQKNQPFIPDQQKQTQYEQQQMLKEREKLQKQQQLEQERQERIEYEKRQQQLYDQAQQQKQIQINNSSLVRPNLGKNKKIDWEKHEEQLSNQQYQLQQQQQQQRQKRQQQIQIDEDVSGGPASGQQIQEQNESRQFNNNQQQNEQQYQKNQVIYNNEENYQKQQVYDENYEYQAQDARGINIGGDQQISLGKIDKQRKRCEDLKQIVQLEFENFDDIFEMKPTSQYEVYINKIKSGAIKNSGDNCKPEQQEMDLQTDPIQNNDFGNQAPDDELRTFLPNLNQNEVGTSNGDFNTGGGINELNNLNQAKNLVDFMENVFPVFEEILSIQKIDQTKEIKKIFDGKFREFENIQIIQKLFKFESIQCTYQSSQDPLISYVCFQCSDQNEKWFQISLIIKFNKYKIEKLFVSSSKIVKILAFKNILTGGSQDGSLIFWDEKELDNHHRKSTNQYVQHIYDTFEKNKVENTNFVFRYSSFSSEFLNKYGAQANADFDFNLNEDLNNKHNSQIVDIIPNIKNNQDLEIFSLEEFGKIIQWNIIELNKEESEMQYIEFGHYSKIKVISPQIIDLNQLGCHANLIAKNMTMDYDENIYVCSSAGILKINKHGSNRTKYPKQYHEILSNSEQPTTVSTCGNSQLFIAGYSDGQIKIFSKSFAEPLYQIQNFSRKAIVGILTPQLQYENSTIHDINGFYAYDKDMNIYKFNLIQNKNAPEQVFQQHERINGGIYSTSQNIHDYNVISFTIKNQQQIYNNFISFNDDIQQLDPQQVKHNNQVIEVDFINYYQTVMGEDNNEL